LARSVTCFRMVHGMRIDPHITSPSTSTATSSYTCRQKFCPIQRGHQVPLFRSTITSAHHRPVGACGARPSVGLAPPCKRASAGRPYITLSSQGRGNSRWLRVSHNSGQSSWQLQQRSCCTRNHRCRTGTDAAMLLSSTCTPCTDAHPSGNGT
jgi:hypothetical protein